MSEFSECIRKTRYATRSDAERALATMIPTLKYDLEVYPCRYRHCGGFHLGSALRTLDARQQRQKNSLR